MAPRKKNPSAGNMKSPDALDRKILAYAQEKAENYAQQQKPAAMFGGRWYSLAASACVLMLAVIIVPGQWSSYVSKNSGGPTAPALILDDGQLVQLDDAGFEYDLSAQSEPSMSLSVTGSHEEAYNEEVVGSESEARDGPNVSVLAAADVGRRARSAPAAMKENVARKLIIERGSIEQKHNEQKSVAQEVVAQEVVEQKIIAKRKAKVKKESLAKRKTRAQYKPELLRGQRISAPKEAGFDEIILTESDSMLAQQDVAEGVTSGSSAQAMVAPAINPNTRKVIALEEPSEAAVPILASPSQNLGEHTKTLTRIEFNEKFDCPLSLSQWKELQRVGELWKAKRVSEAKVASEVKTSHAALESYGCNLPEDEVRLLMNYDFK